ncbi:tyrosine-type recombinase/integrase, partial [Paralimibaculum aggregatum]|uniref:tyrosine-type recombinase/integrase n=1 Tax=Paralimibaculum aggregatum TaxID=3036245 RepID=UPI00255442EC
LAVLQPIWLEKPETARRLRQRLRTVFDWTIAARHRSEANPLAGIEKALPRQADRATHHAALPWAELPALMARLAEAGGSGALALRFCILTAARSGEVRGARWEEVDADRAVWTVPAARMKGGREHRVPLAPAALAVLEAARGHDAALVFPGRSADRPISDMTMTKALRQLGVGATVHGMRSTFRDWAWEQTGTPREIAELCLAHQVGNA